MKKKIILLSIFIVVAIAGIVSGVLISRNSKNNNSVENTQVSKEETQRIIEKKEAFDFISERNNKSSEEITLETALYKVIFDTKGASVKSIILKDYKENNEPLDLILKSNESDRAFLLYGAREVNSHKMSLDSVFDYKIISDDEIAFETVYKVNSDSKADQELKIRKTYKIGSKEYMIALKVDVMSTDGSILGNDGYVYSLGFEPQLGPSFVANRSSQNNQNTRTFYLKFANKKKKKNVNFSGNLFTYESPFQWLELTGKYFSYIIAPQSENFHITLLKSGSEKERTLESRSYLSRVATNESSISDVYNIYLGPQLKSYMKVFNNASDNSFGVQNLNIERGLESGNGAFNWLQNALKWIMSLFYKLIPNWGVSIILLTLLVKFLLYPLQRKSMKSTSKMGELTPRLNEIKEQYKNDPQKMQEATLALYKENDIHPMANFIPLLIQFPILLAMYGLLNKHFELRGAMFIPGWITDLSSPESVVTFPFNVPLLGDSLHILPFLYLLTMILLMVYTQKSTNATQTSFMQKFMTYGFPIIFFFMLYNTSSGLLLYWTFSNVLSLIQQFITNILRKKQKEEEKVVQEQKEKENKPTLYTGVLPPKAKKKEKK